MELKCAILFILLFNTPKLFANASDNSDAEVLPDFEIDKSDNAPAAAEGDEEPPKPENPQLPDTSFEPVESIEPIAPDTDPALSSANAVESVNLNQTNVPLHATITKGARSGKYITWFSSDYDFNQINNTSTIEFESNTATNFENLTTTTQSESTTNRIEQNLGIDPMTSNVSPPEVSQGSNRDNDAQNYILTEARLKEIREHFMYPYYDKGLEDNNGDYQIAIQASTPQVHKNLNFQLPFFGFRYNYTRVSLNGYLEFSDPPPNYHYPLVFPTKEWPKKNDPAFIGIFFSKCKIGNLGVTDVDQREPGVYFRMERDLRGRKDRMGVEIRERIKWDIREGVIGATTFDPKHMIIVTWKNVSFNGGYADAVSKTNTFQMVLATDEVYTYAIFNYLNLVWTSHTEAGGDTRAGEGGVSAYVGFNAGNGTRAHEYLPYSQASVIRDLTATGFGNNKKGRHIFRIDETIMLGSCNKDIDGTNLQLVFAPESGNMLGGTVVNITGPCFKPKDQIMCKFDFADVVYGTVIDYNRAICIQPRLYVEGYVKLEIALNDGNFKFKGKYYVESPAHASQKIFFKDFKQNERNPAEIKMTWEKTNLTTNENAQIKISLWGYRETTIHPEFKFITLLEENVINTGEYTITPGNYRQRNNEFLTDIRFGFIQINLTESIPITSFGATQNVDITPFVWSRPIPLGWYFGPQWEKLYGSKWTVALCDEWLKNDRYLKNFAHELPQCPCTLEQALADKGRFMPDLDCDKDINPQCYYNNQAMHCVKSGSPTMEGSEQQCCYDRNRYLMLSYDQQWGSSPRRCHNLGYAPFNEATKVPTLSQWYNDMVPKYLCCLWQDEQAVGCETLRFERRPSQDCVAYQAPGIAGVYGDPHIVTFDDVEYTFNGKGEFVLLRSNSKSNMLDVQGRFEQMSMNQYGEVRATQLTAVAAKGNTSTVIEVRIRPPEAQWRYRLDVLADGRKLYFDRQALKFQHFLGVTVYTPTYILNQSEVIIMFDNGAGVEVVENKGFMSARVYLPWTFINKTSGLFGNWSFNKEDDLVLPDGTRSPVSVNMNNMKDLYDNFGLKWILDDVADNDKGKSLFHREFGRTSSSYNNVSFVPEFHMKPEEIIPLNRSEYVNIVKQFCTENLYECYYDYSNTLNRDLAHYTSNYKASIYTLKETSRKKVVTCGVLETPRFGRKSTFFFTPGTKVTFECNQDFTLVGDPRRTCLPNGKWNVPDYGYTECLRAQEYSKQQAGVASGIVMAVLIPLVLLFVYIGYKYMKKRNEANNAEAYESEQYEARLRKAQEAAAKKLTAPDDLSDDDSSIVKNKEEQI